MESQSINNHVFQPPTHLVENGSKYTVCGISLAGDIEAYTTDPALATCEKCIELCGLEEFTHDACCA